LAAPLAADGQQAGKVYRIGFLRPGPPPKSFVDAFQHGLRERGYVNRQNVVIEFHFGDVDRLAAELVRSKIDIILAGGGATPALAAKKATTSVPIVFVAVVDPVELGLVAGLARPGGNITGLAYISADLAGKSLELLGQLVPKLRRVAVLWEETNPGNLRQLKSAEVAARTLGLQLHAVPVRGPNDFDVAFNAMHGIDGLLQVPAPLFTTHRARLVELAAISRLPAIYGTKEIVDAGGLMSYAPDVSDLFRRAATYIDKILKGAKPADLPVERPTKFELVINLKTAKALGLTVSPSLLARADQVIE
jgi:putative ABC transport system substrate-binding protein